MASTPPSSAVSFSSMARSFCGVASGLLEGVYQSRPGGKPGKPAIDARRWFLAKYVHSVTDAFYDGKWHYLDIDLGGYAGTVRASVKTIKG